MNFAHAALAFYPHQGQKRALFSLQVMMPTITCGRTLPNSLCISVSLYPIWQDPNYSQLFVGSVSCSIYFFHGSFPSITEFHLIHENSGDSSADLVCPPASRLVLSPSKSNSLTLSDFWSLSPKLRECLAVFVFVPLWLKNCHPAFSCNYYWTYLVGSFLSRITTICCLSLNL